MKVIVKISTSTCGPCRVLKPVFERLEQEFKNQINFKIVSDENEDELIEYCTKYSVNQVPTILVVDENGQLIEKLWGLRSEDAYRNFIQKYIK